MSTERQHDAEMDRLLRLEMRPAAGEESCPGPDLRAAWIEGGVQPDERDALDAHFATCHRCQEALAAVARALPRQGTSRPTAPAWWSFNRLRWIVPVAAAAVLVLYVAVRPVVAPSGPPEMTVARAPEPSPVTQTSASAEADSKAKPTASSTPAAQTKQQATSSLSGAAPGRREVLDKLEPAAPKVAVAENLAAKPLADQASDSTQRAKADARPQAAPAATPAPAAPPAQVASAAKPPVPAATTTAAKPAAAAADVAERRDERAFRMASVTREVAFGDGKTRWRLESAGKLSKSTDAGSTWVTQESGIAVDLLAGSAPSLNVAWLVGKDGTVILTTDGSHWAARNFPEHVDLVAVQAADARSAIVTTRDGRRFSTSDAGATWVLEKQGLFPNP